MNNKLKKHFEIIFLLLVSLIGILLVFYATEPFGPGISGDSVFYLSGAENIVNGIGYIDHYGNPVIMFPPLYSIIMASIIKLFSVSAIVSGRIINGLSFGLIIFLGGKIAQNSFKNKFTIYYCTIAILLARPIFLVTTVIASDPLFIVLILIFFMYVQKYIERKQTSDIIIMALIIGVSVLLRYVGILYILSGILLIGIVEFPNWKKVFNRILLFSSIASLETIYWVGYRNYFQYKTLTGTPYGAVNFIESLKSSFSGISNWYIPYSIQKLIPVSFIFLAITVISIIFIKKYGASFLKNQKNKKLLLFFIISSVIYYFPLVSLSRPADHQHIFDDRYYIVLFIPILFIVLHFVENLISNYLNKFGNLIMVAFLVFLLAYHTESIRSHISKTRNTGGEVYNLYNNSEIRDLEILEYIPELITEDYIVLSNFSDIIYLFSDIRSIPSVRGGQFPTNEELIVEINNWEIVKPMYLIWFDTLRIDQTFFTPKQLDEYFSMELLKETTFEYEYLLNDNWVAETVIEGQIFVINPDGE